MSVNEHVEMRGGAGSTAPDRAGSAGPGGGETRASDTGTAGFFAQLARRLLEPRGIGGNHLLGWLFPCVGQVWRDHLMMGSCTFIGSGRFALTASHVVAQMHRVKRYSVRAGLGDERVEIDVVRIFWPSGEVYDAAVGGWPAQVGAYVGDGEQLALLELAEAAPVSVQADAVRLPRGRSVQTGELLLLAGYGKDAVGNHHATPWVATSRFREIEDSGFGLHAPRLGDLFHGLPRPGDSGGPVFLPPLSDPLPPNHLRLIGVHAGRKTPTGSSDQVAVYVPIDKCAERWIESIIGQAPPLPNPRVLTPASTKGDFVHRGWLDCYFFPKDLSDIAPLSLELATTGKNKLLQHGTRMLTSSVGKQLQLDLVHPERGPITVLLDRFEIQGNCYWYTNDRGNNECYYVFLVNNAPKPKPGDAPRSPLLHIEAFEAQSSHPRPSPCTLSTIGCRAPMPWEAIGSRERPRSYVSDQDDEGNCHEPPP